MISYHPTAQLWKENCVADGWKTANIMDFSRLAKGICSYPWSPIVWKEGKRKAENFVSSVFCVLDFDDGLSLAEATRNFSDCQHIIGTTKSHQKVKSGKPPCDRFRVVIPWRRTISDEQEFKHNMRIVIERYGADENAQGGSRFFHPCIEITSIQKPDDDFFKMDVEEVPEKDALLVGSDYKNYLEMVSALFRLKQTYPKKIGGFIKSGQLFSGGREVCCFWAAKWLLERGMSRLEILEILKNAPFDRDGFDSEREINHAVNAAVNYVRNRLNEKK